MVLAASSDANGNMCVWRDRGIGKAWGISKIEGLGPSERRALGSEL